MDNFTNDTTDRIAGGMVQLRFPVRNTLDAAQLGGAGEIEIVAKKYHSSWACGAQRFDLEGLRVGAEQGTIAEEIDEPGRAGPRAICRMRACLAAVSRFSTVK
jgi:hypothetical protein